MTTPWACPKWPTRPQVFGWRAATSSRTSPLWEECAMKRFALAALLAIAITLTSGKAFAASVSVDLPFQFTFSNEFLDKQKQAKPKDRDATANGFILTATGGLLGA